MSDYDPFRREPAPTPEPGSRGDPVPRDRQMEAPPGLGQGALPSTPHGPVKFSGAVLTGIGGFILIGGLMATIVMSSLISAEAIETRYNGGRDASDDIRFARTITWLVTLPLGALFAGVGTAVWFQQAWARGLGAALLILAALTTVLWVLPPILFVAAAIPLMRAKYAGWFR